MSKTYTPEEAAKAVLDAARKKLEGELNKLQKAEEVGKSLFGLPTQTPSHKAVADGDAVHRPSKGVFDALKKRRAEVQKAETFINTKSPSTPGGARYVEIGKPEGNLPGDKPTKEVSADGSGGEMKKAAPDAGKPPEPPKADAMTAPKPAGVPGAGKPATQAPGVPKPPAAPGAKGTTMKNETCAKGVFARLKKKVK